MYKQQFFTISSPNIVSEIFEDEVVIVNLDNGNYYSLNKIGAEIWSEINKGTKIEKIVDSAADYYDGNKKDIKNNVYHFIETLCQENLITPCDESIQAFSQNTSKHEDNSTTDSKPSFEAPALQKYTDMQELLLLDPIHEVDKSGWPHKKQDAP